MGATEQQRLATYYNGNNYDATLNPGGMANGGHRTNLIPAFQDVAVVGQDCADYAARAEAGASQTDAWKEETSGAVTRISSTQFQVAGVDLTDRYHENRAILLDQTTDAYGYVTTSSYSGGNTIVTLSSGIVATGLSKVFYGQDVRNAPKSGSSSGADLYLYNEYISFGW